MTKREVMKKYLKGNIHIETDCDLNEETDEVFTKAIIQIAEWAKSIDEKLESGRKDIS